MVVLLAFAEPKIANTTTLGLDFSTVWDQTPHRFGLLYYGLDWSTRMEFLSFTTIAFVRFRHGTLLLTLLWWFVSHFTCRFFTFVPCQVTGLLGFYLGQLVFNILESQSRAVCLEDCFRSAH